MPREILFEGLSSEEILNLPQESLNGFILLGEPVVFRAGTSTILGSFKAEADHLVIELAQIDGGGEGVLMSLGSLVRQYAVQHKLQYVEWIVHAINCAKPNLKLRKILDRRGFVVKELPGVGKAYHLIDSI